MTLPALALAAQAADVCDWPDADEEFGWPVDIYDPDLCLTLVVRWALIRTEGAGLLLRVASVEHDLGGME